MSVAQLLTIGYSESVFQLAVHDFERHLAADVCHGSEVGGEDDADHCTNPADAKATRRFSSADRTVASVGPAIHS